MILNNNQRRTAILISSGTIDDDELAKELELKKETIQKIRRELKDKFKRITDLEAEVVREIGETSQKDLDVGLLKEIFLPQHFKKE